MEPEHPRLVKNFIVVKVESQ